MKMRVRPSDLWAKPRLKTRWFETKTTQWYYLTLLVGGIIRVHYLISLNLNIEWCVVNIDSLTWNFMRLRLKMRHPLQLWMRELHSSRVSKKIGIELGYR